VSSQACVQHGLDVMGMIESLDRRSLTGSLLPVETLYSIAMSDERFSPEFLKKAQQKACFAEIRNRLARGYTDENGVHHRFLRIKEIDPETSEIKNGYKQLEFFTIDNIAYAIRDRLKRIDAENAVIRELLDLSVTNFGKAKTKKMMRQLNLDFGLLED
jgi:hypothetical protein